MYKRILVPVDGSAASRLGLNEAIKLAQGLDARIRVLHIIDEFVPDVAVGQAAYYEKWVEALREGGQATIAEAVQLARDQGVEPEAVLIDTIGRRAAAVIVEQAQQWPAEIIVMGTHGRRGVRRLLLGSDAENVIRNASVPVLLVREAPTS